MSTGPAPRRHRSWRPVVPRLSLRWRVAAAVGAGSLLLTGALAVATWNLASGYMVSQRQDSAVRQARVNVRLVDTALRVRSQDLDELLTGLTTGTDSSILVHRPGRWITSGRRVAPSSLPPALVALARTKVAAEQRTRVDGLPVLVVALPVDAADEPGPDFYLELFPLTSLDETFRFLSVLLTLGTLVAGVLGGAIGVWASRRALRPLWALTAAASRIAAGDLAARLPAQSDRDLAPLEHSFNSTAAELEQRVLRDARFAGDVSHELRSPLTAMVTVGEVLHRRRADFDQPVRQAVELLTTALQRFQKMVLDLLEISRGDQGADVPAVDEVDLGELAGSVLTAARLAGTVPGDVPVERQEPVPLVEGDRRMLERALANLVDNAARHGGGPVRIGLAGTPGGVRVEVDDAGPGIPADLRERVFERFARAGGGASPGTGSGLGLALVRQYVHRHGGTVEILDRPGGGARFVVELPVVPP